MMRDIVSKQKWVARSLIAHVSSFHASRARFLLGAFVLFGLIIPATSDAYTIPKNGNQELRWGISTIKVNVNPNIPGSSITPNQVLTVFQEAIDEWKKVKCSKWIGILTKSNRLYTKDGQSTASFPANVSGNNIFQTQYYINNKKQLSEVDVALNPKTQWTLNPNGGGQDLKSVAMVVVGTILGLGSSNEPKATMGGNFLSGSINKRTLHPDDIAGICALYPSGQPQCATDNDCPSGLGCQAAKCVEKAPTAAPQNCKTCSKNADCGSGGKLVCTSVGLGTHCLHKCTPDGLCPTGFTCSGNGTGAECLPTSGSCPKSSCTKDSDCGAGFKCKSKKCEPECSTDQDCTAPQVCISGKCGAKGSCNNDLDCSAGFLCKNGKCEQNTTKQPCNNDNDCPALHSCKNKFCERDATGGCTDGASQACKCPNGKAGTQTCANKQWGACQGCGGGGVCQAGATQKCACPNGTNGTQTCKADGSGWDACQGCGGGGKTCAPGSTQACVCTDGKNGAQTCAGDGSKWEACKCTGGGNLCSAGATQACVCNDGKSGTQSCAADGKSWGACQGCGGGPTTCTAGQSQVCSCANGGTGTQSCNNDGSGWGICICETTGDGGGGTPDTGGGTDNAGPPQACQNHNECPTGHFCVQNICRRSGDGGGCGCQVTNPTQGAIPFLFMFVFLLGLTFHRRLTR